MKLIDLVTNRPIDDTRESDIACPFCPDAPLFNTRCVEERGGELAHYCDCTKCGRIFTRHSFKLFAGPQCVWYTEGSLRHGKVLLVRGFPRSFENIIYECVKCQGPVTLTYLHETKDESIEDGILTETLGSGDVPTRKHYRVKYACERCGNGGVVDGVDHTEAGQRDGARPLLGTGPRKLGVRWTPQVSEDVVAFHGVDEERALSNRVR